MCTCIDSMQSLKLIHFFNLNILSAGMMHTYISISWPTNMGEISSNMHYSFTSYMLQ